MMQSALVFSCCTVLLLTPGVDCTRKDSGPKDLSPSELKAVERALRVEFPDSLSLMRVFVRQYHQGDPALYVRVEFDHGDLEDFTLGSLRSEGEATKRRSAFETTKPLPSWFDVQPIRPDDQVLMRGKAQSVLIRTRNDIAVVFFEVEESTSLDRAVLQELFNHPFAGESHPLGPAIQTGLGQWNAKERVGRSAGSSSVPTSSPYNTHQKHDQ